MANLFRKKAVDNYKEQFSVDTHISKISFPNLLFSVLFIAALVFFLIWFMFGNIVNTVNIKGIVYPTAGVENITAVEAGVISDINVEVGDNVKVGTIVAIVPNEAILKNINNAAENNADKKVIDKLRQDYYSSSVIVAKTSGTVLKTCNEGDYVDKGTPIVTVAANRSEDNQRQILAFLPTSQKNNINKGCNVQVSPDYAPREKFGYINGYVADIDDVVITKSDVESSMNVFNIPNLLEDNENYIAVHINLLPDADTASGLSWTQKNSGNIDVGIGTLCNNSIVVEKNPPYKWLFGGEDW